MHPPQSSVIITNDWIVDVCTTVELSFSKDKNFYIEFSTKAMLSFMGRPYNKRENALMLACLILQSAWSMVLETKLRTSSLNSIEPLSKMV